MEYFVRSTPTLMPSSTSVGATFSPSATTNLAICLTFIMYLLGSVGVSPGKILVIRETEGGIVCVGGGGVAEEERVS